MITASAGQRSSHPSAKGTAGLLYIILILAALLRFHHVTQPFTDAFSWRQVSVAMMAENYYRTNWNIFYPEVNWSGPGPNYQGREFQTVSYIAAWLFATIGQYDWIGRTVTILFGLWGIFALYQLVNRLWGKRHALAAAAVMAVLPGSVLVDRSFLPDPAMVALVVTALWLLILYLQTHQTRYLIAATIIGAWGFCTKLPGMIVGLPALYAVIFMLKAEPPPWQPKAGKLLGWGTLAVMPVLAYYLWARHLALSYPPYHFAGDGNWLWQDGLRQWMAQSYFLPKLQFHLTTWLWTLPGMGLAGIGLNLSPRPGGRAVTPQRPLLPWFFHWWLVAGLLYYAIGAKELVSNPWNFHILSPAIAALAGSALVSLFDLLSHRTKPLWALLAPVLLLLVILRSGTPGFDFVYHPYGDQGYQLGLALQRLTQPSDLVVTISTTYGDPVPIYYSHRRGWGFPPPALDYDWMRFPEDDARAIQLFERLRTLGADWFGIVGQHYDELWGDHPTFAAYLDQHCRFEWQDEVGVVCKILSPDSLVQIPNLPQPKPIPIDYVTQEIHYQRQDAGAVSLVWGVNGWQQAPEDLRPADTEIINKVMYTPMKRKGGIFVATLRVPAGTVIDYGFLITRASNGTSLSLWDAPQGKDYQSIATQDHIIEIGQPAIQSTALTKSAANQPGFRMLLLGSLSVLPIGAILLMRRSPILVARVEALLPYRLLYLHDLLRELVAREMKLRYRRSILGFAWSLLNPLLQVVVFSFVFHYVLPLEIPNYTLFLFIGLLAWNWLQTSLLGATTAIVDSGNLIKRPGFPAAILPIVTISTNLVHFVLALPIVLLFLFLAGIPPTFALVALPVIIALQFLFTLSLGYFFAAIHVSLRDVQHLVNVGLLLGFYLTPIFYNPERIPEQWQWLYRLNPALHLVEAYRAVLLRGEFPVYQPLLWLSLLSVCLLYHGYRWFTKASYRFVEEL